MAEKIDRGPRIYLVVTATETGYRLWGTNVMYIQAAQMKCDRLKEEFPDIKDRFHVVEMHNVYPK